MVFIAILKKKMINSREIIGKKNVIVGSRRKNSKLK